MQASSAISNRTVMQGDYLLLAPIGGEPDNQVFRARARRDGRMVSVRMIVQSQLAVFGSEPILGKAQAASRVRHPALAAVEAYGQERDDTWFIVSEYVEGPRLDEWADALGIPPVVDLIDMIHRVCHGLQAAHRAGLAHDSLHPGNLIILPRLAKPNAPLDVKIMDLSVPALVRPWPPHLQAAAFMAPEQLRLDELVPSSADVRTNVYSCGALLYYLCTGGPPFQSRSLEELAMQHREGRLVPPSKINPRIPAALEEAIMRALSADPRGRFPSTSELANALALIRLPIRLASGRPRSSTPVSQPAFSSDAWPDAGDDARPARPLSHSMTVPRGTAFDGEPLTAPGAQRQPTPASTPSWRPPLGSFSEAPARESGVVPTEEWIPTASFFPAALRSESEITPERPITVTDSDVLASDEPISSPTLVLAAKELEPVSTLESLESLQSLEGPEPAQLPPARQPSYRLFMLTHWTNLAFLGLAAILGAALGPIAWLIGGFFEAAALWIIPDTRRFRAHVDERTMAQLIARERRAYLRQLFGLSEAPRGLGQRLLGLFIEPEPENPDDQIIDQKNEGVRIYRELRQLVTELQKIEGMRGARVIPHEQLLERMVNRYLGLLLIRRMLATALSEIDDDEVADQVQRIEQQLTRATPAARVVLAESLQAYKAQLEKLSTLQASLELCWERMETTRRQLHDLHRRVIGDSQVDVTALLDQLMQRESVAADPFAEMRTNQRLEELMGAVFKVARGL